MTKYTVPPFSGKDYYKNEKRVKSPKWPCAICGRPVDTEKEDGHWAVVVNGGSQWGDDSSDTNDPGYMGSFPVGNDCHRKYKMKEE